MKVMVPVPEVLPPFCEVNHRISLIDPNKRYIERRATCLQSLESLLRTKVGRYERAGWWVAKPCAMACPLLCLAKKDGGLRTVIDARQRNANTVLDVTPMPDMRFLMDSLAWCKYQSKIDMTDVYEQIRVERNCIPLTAFSVPWGTYVSNVLQQGDCNGPSTFQRVVTWALREHIGGLVHAWFDDIFVGTDTLEEHNKMLLWVYLRLEAEHLYISQKKFEPLAPVLDILGSRVDGHGVHADSNKMAKIREWREPCDHKEVLRFLGLIEYLA